VGDILGVHVLNTEQDLLDEVGSLLLGQALLFRYEVEQFAAAKSERKLRIRMHT